MREMINQRYVRLAEQPQMTTAKVTLEDPSRGYTRDDFAEHLRTEFSTLRWLFEPMLAAASRPQLRPSSRKGEARMWNRGCQRRAADMRPNSRARIARYPVAGTRHDCKAASR
jgi:hypothetical protein